MDNQEEHDNQVNQGVENDGQDKIEEVDGVNQNKSDTMTETTNSTKLSQALPNEPEQLENAQVEEYPPVVPDQDFQKTDSETQSNILVEQKK